MTVQTFIDGVEVTDVVQEGSSKHSLGKPWIATANIPIDQAVDGIGKLMKVVDVDLPEPIDHHGRILNVSDNDEEDTGTVQYTSYGPDEIWGWRPARDPDGDFSKPDFLKTFVTGPQIMEAILTQSEDGSDPALGEGDTMIELGSFAGGGADLSGAPTDFPMTIAQIRSILQDSGELDVIVTPIDSGGNIGRVDCYNGNYGTDRSSGPGAVVFEYATGSFNVRQMRRTQDLTKACNKLWYYLSPKYDDQHWKANLTGTDTRLPADGGPPGGLGGSVTSPMSDILSIRDASRAAYLVRMDIRIYDAFQNENAAKPLYWRLWQTESLLRAQPKTIVHVTPQRGIKPTFDIGDLIGVAAGAPFRGGFTGAQRVYDRTISWDKDGVVAIAEIQTSADQEAA